MTQLAHPRFYAVFVEFESRKGVHELLEEAVKTILRSNARDIENEEEGQPDYEEWQLRLYDFQIAATGIWLKYIEESRDWAPDDRRERLK